LDLLHLIHSHSSRLQTIQRYRYSAHFQFTFTHALRFSVFTSRILATYLSQSHCNFKSLMKSPSHSLIPRLDYSRLLLYNPLYSVYYFVASSLSLYKSSARTPRKIQCLQLRWLAIHALLFSSFASSGLCLATRCLAMGMARTT
jgi:hypothetical protein